jgi:Glyoxalase-like domain
MRFQSREEYMATRVGNITFDCYDVLKVAAFWSAALQRGIDDGSSAEFASIGAGDVERSQPAWYFNKVPESKVAKNRVHLDLMNPDANAVRDLVRLGATVLSKQDWEFHSWTVLADPEGNEFCLAAQSFEKAKRTAT